MSGDELEFLVNFQNSFRTLPKFIYEDVKPTPIKNPKLIHRTKLSDEMELNLSDEDLILWLNGEESIPGEQRIATRYAGHQFGVWAGQLGDGRAISLGEIINSQGKRFEIQTKGSGLTPFSRMGDGKAVIRSSVREYLCSEAMAGLKIPTTRVLALMTGEDPVYREEVERSSVVARVFPSNLRFGHFEMLYHFKKPAELEALINYTRETFFQGQSNEEMLLEIVKRTATLMAKWMAVGFCHGVMNTDNMSVLGLTIDYGPFGFLEDTKLDYICNHSDHQGRYAYNRQPDIGHWNLSRLLVCFLGAVSQEKLQDISNSYPEHFEREMKKEAGLKLGLTSSSDNDYQLFMNLMKIMDQLNLDFTFTFRELSRYVKGKPESMKALFDYYGNRVEVIEWLKVYDMRLDQEPTPETTRHELMLKTNPKYVLKNYIAELVIQDVEAGHSQKLTDWLEVFYNPFAEHEAFHKFSLPTPYEHKNLVVSCSS